MVILPDSNYQSLTFIVNTLYSDIAVEVPDNVNMEDLEDTAKIMGVKIPTPDSDKLQDRKEPEEVPTLDENIIKEYTDIEMSNVEASKEFMGNDYAKNITELPIDKDGESISPLLQMIRNLKFSKSLTITKAPLDTLTTGNNKLNMGCLSHIKAFDEKVEKDKRQILGSSIQNLDINTKTCDIEIGDEAKEQSSKCKVTWISDAKIRTIEDFFVENVVTHIPFPQNPKKSNLPRNKRKENPYPSKANNVEMTIVKVTEKMESILVAKNKSPTVTNSLKIVDDKTQSEYNENKTVAPFVRIVDDRRQLSDNENTSELSEKSISDSVMIIQHIIEEIISSIFEQADNAIQVHKKENMSGGNILLEKIERWLSKYKDNAEDESGTEDEMAEEIKNRIAKEQGNNPKRENEFERHNYYKCKRRE